MSYDLIIDEKVEVWRRTRATVEANNLEDAIKKCLKGDYYPIEDELLYDTETLLDPVIEDGPTREIYLNQPGVYEPIYTNNPHKNDNR